MLVFCVTVTRHLFFDATVYFYIQAITDVAVAITVRINIWIGIISDFEIDVTQFQFSIYSIEELFKSSTNLFSFLILAKAHNLLNLQAPCIPTPEDLDMPLCTTALDSLGIDSDDSSLHLPTMPHDFDSDGEEFAWDYVLSENDSNYCDQSEGEEYPALTVEAVPVPEQERLSTILQDNRIVDI
jgi:hypothetical protein